MDPSNFTHSLTQQFHSVQPYLAGSGDLALRALRQRALQQALKTQPPTYKQNTWKYARLDPLLNVTPTLHRHRTRSPLPQTILHSHLAVPTDASFVFINGFYVPSLSHFPKQSKLTFKHFRTMIKNQKSILEALLETSCSTKGFFHQLNAAFVNDGALIIIPSDYVSEQPILITHILIDDGNHQYWVSPQTHIFVEQGAHASIIENTLVIASEAACLNAQTFMTLQPHAKLNYLRLDKGSRHSHTLSHIHITQLRSSELTLNACTLEGGYHRLEIDNHLNGEQAHYDLQGLMLPSKGMHHDWITKLNHLVALCESSQSVKSIIADEGHASYLGSISVNQHAVKTNATMENHHLFLSDKGKADSSPQFEIFCDDVKCNHGSTTGQLDENTLFYLQSRGIPFTQSTEILLHSAIRSFLEPLKTKLKDAIHTLIRDVHHEL